MSITDELRAWAKEHLNRNSIFAIADRIDAEHEAMLVDARKTVYQGYIELPKDADGECIHVGDVLTDDAEFESEGKVMRLMLENEGWMVGFGCGGWTEPSIHEWHHYHAPTVEDVLTEFGIDWEHESDCEDRAALLKEYAAKLKLAKGED